MCYPVVVLLVPLASTQWLHFQGCSRLQCFPSGMNLELSSQIVELFSLEQACLTAVLLETGETGAAVEVVWVEGVYAASKKDVA